jgi:hypothetical protein
MTETTLPPELQPDENGNPPQITEKLLGTLRGKYFTVRHPFLTDCGHRLDMINQPKNNCETCWWTFFNTHPQLVQVADEFFRNQGKNPMIAMRGVKFVKNFLRFMATVHHFLQEQKANGTTNQGQPVADSEDSTADAQAESGQASEVTVADQG